MQISRTERETEVFVLKWADIEKLLGSVARHLPVISISASCTDRLDRAFADIEELKEFSNSQRTAISELRIVAHDDNLLQRFSIALNNDERHNVRITLDAAETTAIYVNDFYQDFLDSVRPWYSLIARADLYLLFLSVVLLIPFGWFMIVLLKGETISVVWPKEGETVKAVLESIFLGLIPLFIGVLLNRFRSKYFPTGTFAFGDGENRHNRNEVFRTVFIAAFVVSIVSSLVVSWFL